MGFKRRSKGAKYPNLVRGKRGRGEVDSSLLKAPRFEERGPKVDPTSWKKGGRKADGETYLFASAAP